MDNVYVYLIDLPNDVKEMVAPCNDGFTVYLNARLSYTGRVKAYCHALEHINNDDFMKENVQNIEADTHKGVYHETHRNISPRQF